MYDNIWQPLFFLTFALAFVLHKFYVLVFPFLILSSILFAWLVLWIIDINENEVAEYVVSMTHL